MKKIWICSALTLTLAAGLLTGCGSSSGSAAGTAGELNIFVWTEYVPDSVIEKFEEETGITVNVSTYSSNEDMLAKVRSESEGAYDIVQPSDYMIEQMIAQDMLEERFDDIISFAGLERFVDVPIKNFSSGMLARLGFSIATIVDADILIIDEILSVGDYQFQNKCKKRIREMMDRNTTVLFVSHSIEQVKEICNRAIWIDRGHIRMMGEAEEVCDAYEDPKEKLT